MLKYILIRTLAVLITSFFTGIGIVLAFSSPTLAFGTVGVALVTALVIALINHTIKPLFMLVSIPINLVTLGLFSFVINGAMILLADKLVPEFEIPSLLMAIYFAIVLSIVNWVLNFFD